MNIKAENFGPVLKSTRAALGLSQCALAGQLSSTQRHISFLETGRSQPSRAFLERLCTDLQLSAGQRSNLYQASGFTNPYKRRSFASHEITETLDMLSDRVLANWPFPAFVLDPHWNILRRNAPAKQLLTLFAPPKKAPENLLHIMLAPDFAGRILNWHEACTAIYFRLQASAAKDESVKRLFEDARQRGLFDQVNTTLRSQVQAPVFVPVDFDLPGIGTIRLTSMIGQLASVQDATVEGFDIELMIPVDAASEHKMRQLFTLRQAAE